MRKTKKILCVLLAMVLLIPNIALFNGVFAQATDETPLQIDVTTDKDSYKAWGIANITVKITNISDEPVNDIKAEAIFEQLAPIGKNSETYKEISSLQPDESLSFSYKATLNSKKVDINFIEKVFLWFVRLFNGGYTAESHNIEADIEKVTEIKFGKYVVENVIWVCTENNSSNMTDEEKAVNAFAEYFDVKNDVNSIDDDYEDENGYILQKDVEEVLKQVAEYAEQKLQQGLIEEYGLEIENNCVWINLKNGIHFVYTPNVEGIDSMDISTYQPCLFSYEAEIQERSITSVDGSAQEIENRIDDYDFLSNYNNQEITLDTIKNIGKNEVVIWHGHGYYDTKVHSALMTSIILDEVEFLLDPIYYLSKIGYTSDYLNGRIFCHSSGYVFVTAKFFEHYLVDLSNTFVYLGTCSSGVDSVLPNAFINKGAEAVVANTGVIHTVYNLDMIEDVCVNMTETSNETNKYYTLGESLNTAKEKNGEVCCSTHSNTEVRIWGNTNYRYTEKTAIEIGTRITLGTYNGNPIYWTCVDINENGPLMLADDILCYKAFDAKGTNKTYHVDSWGYIRERYGSNCWQDSNIRQWLNSDEETVSWTHCPPSSGNVTANPYDTESGFLTNFTDSEKKMIKSVTRVVNVNPYEAKRSGYCDGGSTYINASAFTKSSLNAKSYYYKNVTDSVFLLNAEEWNAIYNSNKKYLEASGMYFLASSIGSNGNCFEHVAASHASATSVGGPRAYEPYGVRPAFYLNINND